VDQAPISELRRAEDGSLVTELERGNLDALRKAGWRPPEVFTAKEGDGVTDIWGVIFRPTNFDPSKRYPVIENIYAGPHGSFVPKTFSVLLADAGPGRARLHRRADRRHGDEQPVEGLSRRRLEEPEGCRLPGPDPLAPGGGGEVPVVRHQRVGIYGGSAGGQNAMARLLFHPDFYKAAVSSAGCHDNRMDKIWWNEQWMGWPIGPALRGVSNVDNAWHLLQGKLLLVWASWTPTWTRFHHAGGERAHQGQQDVRPAGDPGAGHGSGGTYGDRKRNDFFVQHLLGVAGCLQAPRPWGHLQRLEHRHVARRGVEALTVQQEGASVAEGY
jgi:hypothetical protein